MISGKKLLEKPEPPVYPVTFRDNLIVLSAIFAIVGMLSYICWSLADGH